jgi:hypothetical protein
MWWARGKDDDASSASSSNKKRTTSTPSKKSRLGVGRQKNSPASSSLVSRRRPLLGKKNKSTSLRGFGGQDEDNDDDDDYKEADFTTQTSASCIGVETNEENEDIAVEKTEVGEPQEMPADAAPPKTVISFQREIISREKVNRGQFDVASWPALSTKKNSRHGSAPVVGAPPNARTGRHRVKLAAGEDVKEAELSFQDTLFLLRSHEVVDEVSCIETEIKLLNSELEALREDRTHLEAMSLQIPEDPHNKAADWDKHRLLAGRRISQAQRQLLQMKRGNELTICLRNTMTVKALAESLGAKKSVLNDYSGDDRPQKVLHLSPQNCREGGAARTLQCISFLQQENEDPSLFFSHDHSKGNWLGRLPARLFRRMKDNGINPKEAAANLIFLASGPMEYYFAEFRSGEKWWGSPPSDEAFHTICSEWDICHVAFGPLTPLHGATADRKEHLSASWVLLGRDGRVAWKNVPTRLHFMLKNRLADEAAIEDVALGSGGSYFVRFLDGTIDYCLPAHIAVVCQELEQAGAALTSMSLHPNFPHDVVIRSTREHMKYS